LDRSAARFIISVEWGEPFVRCGIDDDAAGCTCPA
jgi:hypothetical protein